jgi:four helix bundle protein
LTVANKVPPPAQEVQMGEFRKLEAWQKARDLVGRVYTSTSSFPKAELFGLTGQMRRAAVSIAANIAEGKGKNNDREFKRYLGIALGSQAELECLATLAGDLNFLDPKTSAELEQAAKDVGSLMAALRRRL